MNTRCVRCDVPLCSPRIVPPPGVGRSGGRGLCQNCHAWARYHDRLLDYPRSTRSRDDLLEDYVMLRREGYDWPLCAERLGMTYAAFERAIHRARDAGDPRAARLGERWPVAS